MQLTAVLPRTANFAAVPSDGPPAGAEVTITDAKPDTTPLVALTVLENDPLDDPAVKRPEPLLMVPPPFTTDQVGAGEMGITTPAPSCPVAVNC